MQQSNTWHVTHREHKPASLPPSAAWGKLPASEAANWSDTTAPRQHHRLLLLLFS